ncbi:MAG: hypothetical protein ACK5JH_09645 [Anaerocolumna sp.]
MNITELYKKNREMYLQNISTYLFMDSILKKYGTIQNFFDVNRDAILFNERTLQRALKKFNFQSNIINESWEFLDITQEEFIKRIDFNDNIVSYGTYLTALREILQDFPDFYKMNRKKQTALWNKYYSEVINDYNMCYNIDEWGNNTEILQMFSCLPTKCEVLFLYFFDKLAEQKDNNYITIAFICSLLQHKDLQILMEYFRLLYETLPDKPIDIQELVNSSSEDENNILIAFMKKMWDRKSSGRKELETFINNSFIDKLIKTDYLGKERIYDIVYYLSICDIDNTELFFNFLILNIENSELNTQQEIFARLADHIYIMNYNG